MSRTNSCKKFALPLLIITTGLAAFSSSIWLFALQTNAKIAVTNIGQQFVDEQCGSFENDACILVNDTDTCKTLEAKCANDSKTASIYEDLDFGIFALFMYGFSGLAGGVGLLYRRCRRSSASTDATRLLGASSESKTSPISDSPSRDPAVEAPDDVEQQTYQGAAP